MQPPPKVLTIAGSDPSGGAGIQADLKAFSALGAYGCAVLTALTAQNTQGVTGVHHVPGDFVRAQLDTLFADVRIDALKIGMVDTAEVAHAIADLLEQAEVPTVVLDPVMVSKSGHRLLQADAVAALKERLLPLATVLTPNLPEAADLLDTPEARSHEEMESQVTGLLPLGPRSVLLKGGHLEGETSSDLFFDGETLTVLEAPRRLTRNTHGTGCTLSASIAALAPRADSSLDAVRGAKEYLTRAIEAADDLEVGKGQGPVHHFHAIW